MSIYKIKKLKKPNFFQKTFGLNPKYNYVIELNNLFVKHEMDIYKISNYDIERLDIKYNVKLTDFLTEKLNIFEEYLKDCLLDEKLDTYDKDALEYIRNILSLPPEVTFKKIKKWTKSIYRDIVLSIISDGKVNEVEETKLEEYKIKLDLTISETKNIYIEEANKYFIEYVNEIIADDRVNPVEEQTLYAIAKNLNINVNIPDELAHKLNKFKLYWQIEHDEIPIIESDIKLIRGEKLYFKGKDVDWLEMRKVTKRYNYAGPTARIKIAKGIYYRLGSISVQPVTEDEWRTIDSGSIYVTNKRLIFMGDKSNKTIRLNRILDIIAYSNGVDIQKDSGRSPFLQFYDSVDTFSMILMRAIRDY